MEKVYLDKTVYQAARERLDYIFSEFDNIYVSFSGGKDSGLLLNLVLQYMADRGVTRKLGLYPQDFEAQYAATSDYVDRTFAAMPDRIERYWCCLPMAVRNAMSNYDPWWYPWDEDKRDLWVRPMPERPYVINTDNCPFDFYDPQMPPERVYDYFSRWYGAHCGGGRTVALLGVRADESLNRYSSVINKRNGYNGVRWITRRRKNVYSAAPLYDWTTEDVWTANGKLGFAYNRLYDLYYKAGVPLTEMRVASPFVEWAGASLSLYRIIEPETWARMAERVDGANFGAAYGSTKAMGYKAVSCPAGHTWKSYAMFLLSTLPKGIRQGYDAKINASPAFAAADDDGASWKRMCTCVLKNDCVCRFMNLGAAEQRKTQSASIKAKYAAVIRGKEPPK